MPGRKASEQENSTKAKNHLSEFTSTKCSSICGGSHHLHNSTTSKIRIGLCGASTKNDTERFRKIAQLSQIQIEQSKNTSDHENNGNHGVCEESTGEVYLPPNPTP